MKEKRRKGKCGKERVIIKKGKISAGKIKVRKGRRK